MKFKVKSVKWNKVEADALVMFVSSDRWVSEIALLDKSYSGNLKKDLELDKFEAKLGKLIAYPTFGQLPAKSVVLVGVGESEKLDPAKLRQAAGHLARYLKNSHKQTVALDLSLPLLAKIAPEQEAQVVVEGLALGAYKFNKYKLGRATSPSLKILLTFYMKNFIYNRFGVYLKRPDAHNEMQRTFLVPMISKRTKTNIRRIL